MIASFCKSEYSGLWVSEKTLTQSIKPNTLRAMIVAGWVVTKFKGDTRICKLTEHGWEVRRSLIGSHLDDHIQKGVLYHSKGQFWRVDAIAPGEVVVITTYGTEGQDE